MRTTLNLDDRLIRKAKQRALDDGTTLSKVIEQALERELTAPPADAAPFMLHTFVDAPAAPIDIANRDALYELMDGDAAPTSDRPER